MMLDIIKKLSKGNKVKKVNLLGLKRANKNYLKIFIKLSLSFDEQITTFF